MFTVYILYSRQFDKIYVGYTSNLESRLNAHNHPKNTGWTKRFQPWEVIYTEIYDEKEKAAEREKQLKSSRGRAFIRSIIKN